MEHIEHITSSSNGQIKLLKELQTKARKRKESGTFVAEGRKMAQEACALGIAKALYVSESFLAQEDMGWAQGVPYTAVSDQVLREAADTRTPQGILAVVAQSSFSAAVFDREQLRLLLLEDIRDPGNLGTMIRTAEGAGVDAILASKGTADCYNPKVVRSTMGSIYRMPVFYVDDFAGELRRLAEQKVTLFAAHLKGTESYDAVSYPARCGILIGNEAKGLSDTAAGLAHQYVRIPMAGKVESLNAAVAAALLMYQARTSAIY